MPSLGSSSSSTSSSLQEFASLIHAIKTEAIANLVCTTSGCTSCTVEADPKQGSYNLIYTTHLSTGEIWVVRFPHPAVHDPVSMEADLQVLRMLRRETSIPVPRVQAYDVTDKNVIGFPYSILSYIPGVPLGLDWVRVLDDKRRHRLLDQIAEAMLQLKKFTFPAIGDLVWDETNSSFVVGPLRENPALDPMYEFRAVSETEVPSQITERGPFSSVRKYLLSSLACQREQYPTQGWAHAWLHLFAMALPDARYDEAPFVLRHPDFNPQNVIINPDTAELMGFIDWDGVSTTHPREQGYACYPSWITRDWDPIMYVWEGPNHHVSASISDSEALRDGIEVSSDSSDSVSDEPIEESPEALAGHRAYYHSAVARIDPELAKITRNSHVPEALFSAIHSNLTRSGIIDKLMDYMFSPDPIKTGYLDGAMADGDWYKETFPELVEAMKNIRRSGGT
ncbi:kinase-like protein [Sistotremastrum suecicum HHB10207 ss-3]|uniref:Kinase-like protein n=1 Tax=Sistotremastrum suecicum HHB10207 ss-3 TaxID=1314776 RepID=A0A165YU38_9AGAM|nr:kinase-like protein [Sistotremastrum suecicum HHB10207 ss-3]